MLLRSLDEISPEEVDIPGMKGVTTQSAFIEHEMLPGFHVRMFSLEPKGCTGLHWHRQQHVHYIVSGEGLFVGKDEQETPIQAGQVVLVPSLDPHSVINSSDHSVLRFFDVVGPCGYNPG
ncbi:MAG: cupin domain-containing protein [Pseudomonadales bacterium]|jgi:mannose-6-phosphate isomerase-like protein (cupin superfamily)|nr:cupin domain-containing protein [Pseudomonadales bacterium]MDP7358933.1 cupin domain-containing protein [Pseudomonadales bacterium]MDP7596516.1 cupin domain-containing protein [Pseudomonadales bacterium]HJN49586.1 cupin domain-containing protein [Pseudomonadales bacterium]|tara:strand:+ start:643 stop:1002 length:360 start_codon:yes stop_codon:yes gene_type:complete